jgi:ribosomal protein S18 acetylase RimI-like enzyme
MKDTLIMPAVLEDIEKIAGFDQLACSDTSHLDFINRIVNAGQCYVVEHEKLIVGYSSLEYSFYGYGFVSMLYINPAYRRQGLGTQIMIYLESMCKTEKLFTSTNRSNKPMQALLESLGFVPSGILENLDEGDPELVYYKKLNIQPKG